MFNDELLQESLAKSETKIPIIIIYGVLVLVVLINTIRTDKFSRLKQ